MTSRPKFRRSFRLAVLLLSGSALTGIPLVGAVYAAETWTGTTSSDWFTAGNWDGNAVPTTSDVATIDTVATNPTVIDTAAATASTLVVASSSGTTGSLTISNGGSLTAGTATLAENGATSSATVTLQGGSTMTLTDSLSTFLVGGQGVAHLNVFSGSTLNANGTVLGDSLGSFGYAEVSGAGSVWSNAALQIGHTGTGSVTVDSGGALNADTVLVGGGSGAGSMGVTDATTLVNAANLVVAAGSGTGTVTVENSAVFHVTGVTVVGGPYPGNPASSGGVGTLNIFAGGVVHSDGNASVGDSANTQGNVTVDGTNSQWTVGAALYVGNAGTGSVTVSSGGLLSAGNQLVLGQDAGSTGTLTLNSGATLNAGSLSVGLSGNGTMNVQSGATVTAGDTTVGTSPGSTGSLLIDGMNSHMTVGLFTMGENGVGTMTISGGGLLIGQNDGFVGYFGDATIPTSTATVTGAGSEWALGVHNLTLGFNSGSAGSLTVSSGGAVNMNNLTIGAGGTGSLTATTGGTLSVDTVVLGQDAGSTGTLTLNSGATFGAGSLSIGLSGNGTMNVQSGATVTAGDTTVGTSPGSTGSLLIDGMNSHMTVGLFTMGENGVGTMTISGGGLLIGQNDGFVGYFGDATIPTSTATVTGAGSEWALGVHDLSLGFSASSTGSLTVSSGGAVNMNGLTIGVSGTGSLMVSGGSAVNAGGDIKIGQMAGASGSVTVDTGSILTGASEIYVGEDGTGSLAITNGGIVSAGNGIFLGEDAHGSGTVSVDGTGSTLNAGSVITVGDTNAGSLLVTNGGHVNTQDLYIAGENTSTASITVDGAAMFLSDGLFVGEHGNGTLTISNTGEVVTPLAIVGDVAGATGVVTLNTSSSIQGLTDLIVGNFGTGTLTADSGSIDAGYIHVGKELGGVGTLSVIDGGTASASTTLVVGGDEVDPTSGGTGTVNIASGGVFSMQAAVLGMGAASNGTVIVDGANSSFAANGEIAIGEFGAGTFSVQNGGVATVGDTTYIGHQHGATGTLTVAGAGSQFISTNHIFVGGDPLNASGGTGTVNITNGGAISTADSIYLGISPDSTGTMTVDGAGSTASFAGFFVGYGGTGNATVQNGGAVTAGILVDIASIPNSTGTLTIDGAGSSVSSTSFAGIGDFGNGTLLVRNGGTFTTAGQAYIGYEAAGGFTGVGTATVDGTGSSLVSQSLDVGFYGHGQLILSNGGVASAPVLTVATQAGSVGEIDIGAAPGSAAAAPGTLSTSMVAFGAGTGSLNFNHTDANYTFAPSLTGAGTINQIAGTTFLSADSSGFTGPTNITGGALHVNGSLKNSAVTVSGGGTLNGNGTVGSVSAANGGIVAPGNSIGTLTVNGNYSAASGSVYQAQLDSAGHADLLKVTGAATLANGAVLNITKTDAGGYAPGQYTLLTAAGGINGTYIVTGDVLQSAFVSENATYDAHDVYLNVSKTATFASAGATPNQIAVGGGADSLPTTSPLYATLVSLPTFAAARGAFDQLSGEIQASARTALVEDSRFVREAALDRLAAPNVNHPVVWGQGFGDWGSNDGNGNAAGMNRSTKGFIGGVDLPVGQTWRVGVLGGFSNTGLNVQNRSSAGIGDNYHLGVYGGTESGPVAVRAGASYSWNGLQTARTVAFNGFTDRLTAQYNGGTTQGFGEIGYKIAVDAVSLEPFANLAYVSLHTSAFKEAGGVSALSVSGDTTSTTFTTLGIHAKEQIDLGTSTIFTARGSLGWRHAFGDITPVATNAFAGGTAFAIDGVPVAQDAMAVDAGFDAAVSEHLTLGLSYTGQYASSARDNGIKASVGWKF